MTYDLGIYRPLNDVELAIYHFQSRTKDPKWTGKAQAPQIVQMSDRLVKMNIHKTRLNTAWQKFQDGLNPIAVSNYLHHTNAGLVAGTGTHMKYMSFTTAGGPNRLKIVEVQGICGKVQTYRLTDAPPNSLITKALIATGMYDKTLIHQFNIVRKDGTLTNTPKGRALYALISDVDLWTDMRRLAKA